MKLQYELKMLQKDFAAVPYIWPNDITSDGVTSR